MSTFISSYVYEFKNDDEVREFIEQENHAKLSTMLTTEVTSEVTSYIEDPDEPPEYDDGIPKIYNLNFGFYAVPKNEDILGYMMSVDNGLIAKHQHFDISGYISSEAYYGPNYESSIGPDGEEWKVKP